jgi:hypothetical protein
MSTRVQFRNFLMATILLIVIAGASTAYAQDSGELRLRLSRDFGYSSLNYSQIQGTFSLTVTGPDTLSRVSFFIDDQVLDEVDKPPFRLRFVTDNYPLGSHTLSATGITEGGRQLRSNVIRTEFVSSSQGSGTAILIIGAILGIIVLGMGIAFLFGNVLGKGKKSDLPLGASRNYGALGGTICRNCRRPFAIHIYGVNLLVGRFDRCPYCGKWSLIRRASMHELKQAEAAELEWATPKRQVSVGKKEDDFLKDLEDTRYQDF